jgi:hypothetical protein
MAERWQWMGRLKLHKGAARSEVRAMLNQALSLQRQLRETESGLAEFIARAERVAALMDPHGGNVDEL